MCVKSRDEHDQHYPHQSHNQSVSGVADNLLREQSHLSCFVHSGQSLSICGANKVIRQNLHDAEKVTNYIVVDTGDTASMFECILEECNLLGVSG